MGDSSVQERRFFVEPDAKEALSNNIVSYLGFIHKLEGTRLEKLEPIISRIVCIPVLPVCAGLDAAYNVIWLIIKTGFVGARQVVRVVTMDKYGHMAEQVTVNDLKIHAFKTMAFTIAIPVAPIVGAISPEYIVKRYKQRDLIVGKEEDGRLVALFKKIPGAEAALEKVPGLEVGLKKVEKGAEVSLTLAREAADKVEEVVKEHPYITLTAVTGAAGVTLTLVNNLSVHLKKV